MQWPRCVGVSTMSLSIVGLLGVLGLALTACGSDDGEGSAQPRTPALESPPASTTTPTRSSTPTTPPGSPDDLQDPILRLNPGTELRGDRNYDLLIGQSYQAEISACGGVRVLYPSINNATWITDEAGDELDWIPSEWSDIRSPESIITAELLLSDDNNLIVTVADRSVTYRPITPDEPASLCAF